MFCSTASSWRSFKPRCVFYLILKCLSKSVQQRQEINWLENPSEQSINISCRKQYIWNSNKTTSIPKFLNRSIRFEKFRPATKMLFKWLTVTRFQLNESANFRFSPPALRISGPVSQLYQLFRAFFSWNL